MTHNRPSSTVTGPNVRLSTGVFSKMYGSSSGTPSTVTRPSGSQHWTVCPPTAITRLTKSSSLGGATPTVRPSHSRAPANQLVGSLTVTSGDQVSGPLNTTMSPGSGSPNQ